LDSEHCALMDGHHRLAAAKALGLAVVPVISMSYDDPAVVLKSWRPGLTFTPQDIWDICTTGKLLPQKSTRHVIMAHLPSCRVPIERLRDIANATAIVAPAAPHPSRVQILADTYHDFGALLGMRTISGAGLDLESAVTLVPHRHLRLCLERDPAMAALLPGATCHVALGRHGDVPFRLKRPDLLLLPPILLERPAAMSAAARWGIEAAHALNGPPPDAARLAAVLRHGAKLLQTLSADDRGLLVDAAGTAPLAELLGSDLSNPSQNLLNWIAGLMGRPQPAPAKPSALVWLEAPIEDVLVSNGDARLQIDRKTGKNAYGTVPRPRPEAVHFSSSTASSISDYGFLYCDVLRRDLLAHIDEGADPAKARADLADAVIQTLAGICGLAASEVDGAIAASGTDTELLAVLLARAASPELPLCNILISPEETGRGIKFAAGGQWFDNISATGEQITKGAEIWPGAQITVAEVPLRDASGRRLTIEEIDARFLAAGRDALEKGRRVLAHVLIGSKTGLSGPSDSAVASLRALAPDRVDIVLDACQMRIDPAQLGRYVQDGWMVQISGSKSLTGPPFSGAILFPVAMRDRAEAVGALSKPEIGYSEDWSNWWSERLQPSAKMPEFGAAFRWLPALLEVALLRHVSADLRSFAFERFRAEVGERLALSPNLRILALDDHALRADEDTFTRNSIVSFEVLARQWDGSRTALDEKDCRRIFELLNSDARSILPQIGHAEAMILRQEFHIGQPVGLGEGINKRAVLRLVVGMRFFNIIAHAGPGGIMAALESEISDLLRAMDKLEILAENWWRYRNDLT
jgi:hypothetical protein